MKLRAAESCSIGAMAATAPRALLAGSSDEFKSELSIPLAARWPEREVACPGSAPAAGRLNNAPYPLGRPPGPAGMNLSNLLGPAIAGISSAAIWASSLNPARSRSIDIQFVELALEDYKTRLPRVSPRSSTACAGTTARSCRIFPLPPPVRWAPTGEILMWEPCHGDLTGIRADKDRGRHIAGTARTLACPAARLS